MQNAYGSRRLPWTPQLHRGPRFGRDFGSEHVVNLILENQFLPCPHPSPSSFSVPLTMWHEVTTHPPPAFLLCFFFVSRHLIYFLAAYLFIKQIFSHGPSPAPQGLVSFCDAQSLVSRIACSDANTASVTGNHEPRGGWHAITTEYLFCARLCCLLASVVPGMRC